MLAKSKLNSIETLIFQALIDINKYEKTKENLRSENEKYVSKDTSCKQSIKL